MSLTGFLGRQSNFFLLAVALGAVAATAFYDYRTQFTLGFYVFYSLPIIMVTWYVNAPAGFFLAALSTAVWALAEGGTGRSYGHPALPWIIAGLRFSSFSLVIVFLSKLRRGFERKKKESRTDSLTGLINRRTFVATAVLEIERARRHRHPFTVGFIDIDNFKTVNDRYGHRRGDKLLQITATTIKNNVRNIDVVARFGGDEFVLLLPETGEGPAETLFHRLNGRLQGTIGVDFWPATYSFGVATFVTPPDSVDEIIVKADHLMYYAKEHGKSMIRHETYGK